MVYEIPTKYNAAFVSQMSRRVNDRLREHYCLHDCSVLLHLKLRVKECGCRVPFKGKSTIGSQGPQHTHKTIEAFRINEPAQRCIYHPSLGLSKKKIAFLGGQ